MAPKVLLVDDDVDFVKINQAHLEKAGFEVLTAYDGQEGLERARQSRPDVMVLDYMMARPTEGAFVAQEMKDDPELKDIPILLLTSVGAKHPWWRVQKDDQYLPVDEFLDKPVPPERLVEEVRKLLKA